MQKLLLLIFTIGFMSVQSAPKKSILTVEVRGIKKSVGKIFVAVFRKKDDFPSASGRFKYSIVEAKAGNTTANLELPNDTYAVAVFHDANDNTVMDKNMFGVPIEIYGFGNNARGTFSAPSFEEAAIELKQDKKIVVYIK
jgi:uncharacterized protein (DUF2141 family)